MLVVLAALPDLLDGALAKASGTASQRGAFFDSTVDRVTDALLLGGVAWYLAGHDSAYLTLLPFAIMAISSLISYQRAKAESLGLDAKGGLMERAERVVLLCIGLLFEPLLVPVLWLLLALTTFTAAQRFVKVWRQAQVAPVTAARIELRRSRRQSRRDRPHRATSHARAPAPHLTHGVPARSDVTRPAASGQRRDVRRVPRRLRLLPVAARLRRRGRAPSRSGSGPTCCARIGGRWSSGTCGASTRRSKGGGCARPCRSRSTRTPGTGSRASGCRRRRRASWRPASTSRATSTSSPASSEERGVILALPHLGGWEWAGRWLAMQGNRVTAIVEQIDPPELFDWFAELRNDLGMTVVALGPDAGRQVLRALGNNEIVCLLCDRDITGGGVEVEFFGETHDAPGGAGDDRPAGQGAGAAGGRVLHIAGATATWRSCGRPRRWSARAGCGRTSPGGPRP